MANDPEEKQPPKPGQDPADKTPSAQPDNSAEAASSEARKIAASETGATDVGSVPHPAEDNARAAAGDQAKQTEKTAEQTSGVPAMPPAPKPPAPAAAVPPKPAAPAGAAAPPKAAVPAAAAPPKPAAPKEAPPKPEPLDNPLVQRFKKKFGDGILEAWTDRKQAILVVETARLAEISEFARDSEKFDFLSDLTAVDWPKREKRFDVVLNLYSIKKNERLRIKAHAAENELVPSVSGVWTTANWMEREVFDMFGIIYSGHPNLKRILLPDEWQGFPLRKDYDILTQDTAWIRENLGIESGQ